MSENGSRSSTGHMVATDRQRRNRHIQPSQSGSAQSVDRDRSRSRSRSRSHGSRQSPPPNSRSNDDNNSNSNINAIGLTVPMPKESIQLPLLKDLDGETSIVTLEVLNKMETRENYKIKQTMLTYHAYNINVNKELKEDIELRMDIKNKELEKDMTQQMHQLSDQIKTWTDGDSVNQESTCNGGDIQPKYNNINKHNTLNYVIDCLSFPEHLLKNDINNGKYLDIFVGSVKTPDFYELLMTKLPNCSIFGGIKKLFHPKSKKWTQYQLFLRSDMEYAAYKTKFMHFDNEEYDSNSELKARIGNGWNITSFVTNQGRKKKGLAVDIIYGRDNRNDNNIRYHAFIFTKMSAISDESVVQNNGGIEEEQRQNEENRSEVSEQVIENEIEMIEQQSNENNKSPSEHSEHQPIDWRSCLSDF